jgi:hypothetical protein
MLCARPFASSFGVFERPIAPATLGNERVQLNAARSFEYPHIWMHLDVSGVFTQPGPEAVTKDISVKYGQAL